MEFSLLQFFQNIGLGPSAFAWLVAFLLGTERFFKWRSDSVTAKASADIEESKLTKETIFKLIGDLREEIDRLHKELQHTRAELREAEGKIRELMMELAAYKAGKLQS